jgi:hypothetical protein
MGFGILETSFDALEMGFGALKMSFEVVTAGEL